MPSAKILSEKQAYVADLKAKFESAVSGCVVAYGGINVENDTKLRKELREAGVHYAVVKNTLLHLAVQDAGLQELDNVLSGTTAIALSEDDYVAPARILCKFADASKTFTVKSGFLDGDVIGLEKINSLAKLPSREILLATVCNAFNAPIASFARAIQAIVDKSGEAVPAQAEAPAEA